MNDRDSFLAVLIAKPEDDTPRLVYADWLDDHGEAERAEFIRVQCELAIDYADRNEMGQYHPRAERLRRRERELLALRPDGCDENARRWFPEYRLLSVFCAGGLPWTYRRGFVSTITLTAADFLTHADALLQAQPIAHVRLTAWPDQKWGRYRLAFTFEEVLVAIAAEWPRLMLEWPPGLASRASHPDRPGSAAAGP